MQHVDDDDDDDESGMSAWWKVLVIPFKKEKYIESCWLSEREKLIIKIHFDKIKDMIEKEDGIKGMMEVTFIGFLSRSI